MFNAKVHHGSMTDFDQLAPWVDGIQNTGDGGAESADGIDSFLNIVNREGWESW